MRHSLYFQIFLFTISIFFLGGCLSGSKRHPLLPQILKAEDHFLRMETSTALEILKPMEQTDLESLPDKYFDLRVKTHLRALQFREALDVVLMWEEQRKTKFIDKRRHVLLSFLRNRATRSNQQIQFEAIKALGDLGDKKMMGVLQEIFPKSGDVVKLAIAYTMAKFGDWDRAVSYLIKRSEFATARERFLASLKLIELSDLRLKDKYLKLLNDSEDGIRVLGLNIVAEKQIFEGLDRIKYLNKNSTSLSMKILTAQALMRLGVRKAEQDLEAALTNPALKMTVELLLAQAGRIDMIDQLKSKISELSDESKSALYKVLMNSGQENFVLTQSRSSLKNLVGEVFDQKISLESLGDLGTVDDFEIVRPFLGSPFEQVQVSAVWSMIRILDRHQSEFL
tara:strand:+ start:439 stop:1626 length:1188 start_codon:yes stop_codon:yes gene_type:complete